MAIVRSRRGQEHSPGWRVDPTGRHQFREWDGHRWTEHVSDAGVASIDPLHARERFARRKRRRSAGFRSVFHIAR